MRVPHTSHCLRGAILDAQLLIEPLDRGQGGRLGSCALEPRGDAVVGELGPVEHHGPINIASGYHAVRGDRHVDDDRQPFLALAQRR